MGMSGSNLLEKVQWALIFMYLYFSTTITNIPNSVVRDLSENGNLIDDLV